MDQYLPLLVMMILATLFAGLSIIASKILGPKKPTPAKLAPYECGIVPDGEPAERFPVRFYLVAMLFIVFDIEIIFLYPWAVIYRELGAFGLWAMLIFVAGIFESFLYLIGSGALNWGPVKRLTPLTDSRRTTESTVRRVGAEGRSGTPERQRAEQGAA